MCRHLRQAYMQCVNTNWPCVETSFKLKVFKTVQFFHINTLLGQRVSSSLSLSLSEPCCHSHTLPILSILLISPHLPIKPSSTQITTTIMSSSRPKRAMRQTSPAEGSRARKKGKSAVDQNEASKPQIYRLGYLEIILCKIFRIEKWFLVYGYISLGSLNMGLILRTFFIIKGGRCLWVWGWMCILCWLS